MNENKFLIIDFHVDTGKPFYFERIMGFSCNISHVRIYTISLLSTGRYMNIISIDHPQPPNIRSHKDFKDYKTALAEAQRVVTNLTQAHKKVYPDIIFHTFDQEMIGWERKQIIDWFEEEKSFNVKIYHPVKVEDH